MALSSPLRAARYMRACITQSSRHATHQRTPAFRTSPVPCTRALTTTPRHDHNPVSNSTVDPTEVSHFNALASSWWDPHGPSRLLHLMNPLRHDFIAQCQSTDSPPPSNSRRYLDIGCGGGIFAESAARISTTASVTAIDPTPEVLRIAEGHKRRDPMLMQEGRLTYVNTSIENLARPKSEKEMYDVVSLFEVIEHVNAPGLFLEHVIPHVKPGGWIIMSTIARTWTSWLVTNIMAEDVLGIVPKGTHEWNKYVNEGELRSWFAKQQGWGGGVGGVRTLGVVYVPGFGWKEVVGGEQWGNYFFGVRKDRE